MSSTIWTRCAGADHVRPLSLRASRMVEAQHRVATQKLVDDVAEQQVLEELLERVKPPLPATTHGLHYLLATPFRYPPLRHGSRFGRRTERGLWYGARDRRAVLAEVAYYRFVFLDDTAAELDAVTTEHTLFSATIDVVEGVDLTAAPFERHHRIPTDPCSYAATQPLGSAMRAAGVRAFLFRSARDPAGGTNVGVFDPEAFGRKSPVGGLQTWHCLARPERVVFTRRDLLRSDVVELPRRDFADADGALQRVR